MRLGAVLLAAGRSERFGENKLLADFAGRPMIACALEAVCAVCPARAVVVTGSERIAELARSEGFEVCDNAAPELGQSHSIHLGVSALREMDALLLMVADQPLLSGASLVGLMAAFAQSGKGMACLCDRTHRGNPAVFSAAYYDALCALHGDGGAKPILRAHEEDLLIVPCVGEDELADADTPQAFETLRQRMGK